MDRVHSRRRSRSRSPVRKYDRNGSRERDRPTQRYRDRWVADLIHLRLLIHASTILLRSHSPIARRSSHSHRSRSPVAASGGDRRGHGGNRVNKKQEDYYYSKEFKKWAGEERRLNPRKWLHGLCIYWITFFVCTACLQLISLLYLTLSKQWVTSISIPGESIPVPSPGNIWTQRTYLGEPRPADILQVRTDRPNAVGVRHEDWSIARLLFRLLPGTLVWI